MTNMKNIDIEELKKNEVFKVPDNYFDTLTDRVMSKLPDEEEKIISISSGKRNHSGWWKWSSIAACITLAIVGTTFLARNYGGNMNKDNSELANNFEYDSQDEMIEYSMLDNGDVYNYLAGIDY